MVVWPVVATRIVIARIVVSSVVVVGWIAGIGVTIAVVRIRCREWRKWEAEAEREISMRECRSTTQCNDNRYDSCNYCFPDVLHTNPLSTGANYIITRSGNIINVVLF